MHTGEKNCKFMLHLPVSETGTFRIVSRPSCECIKYAYLSQNMHNYFCSFYKNVSRITNCLDSNLNLCSHKSGLGYTLDYSVSVVRVFLPPYEREENVLWSSGQDVFRTKHTWPLLHNTFLRNMICCHNTSFTNTN